MWEDARRLYPRSRHRWVLGNYASRRSADPNRRSARSESHLKGQK
jgi:hypothetical protein